ncbi:retrovirus-related pol polyprotein from transposon TNT 1-94 [Tanacetum coccineum]
MAIPPTPPVTQPPIAINNVNDPLYIGSSDHPGMVLTNTPFNGTNFDGWSRNVKMALGAKLKLGFIDGTCNRPSVDNVDKQRYGQSNGPLIYQLERELSQITQGNLTIASFFNKLKRCWDELQSLNGLPTCNCGKMRECTCSVIEKFIERNSNSKLIQFLIKLSDGYEYVRSQILAMDPLPSVNKAFYIVQQIEKQKQITNHAFEPTAFFASMNNKRGSSSKRDGKNFRNDYRHEVKRTYGTSKIVNIVGKVQLTANLILTDVFYVPQFQLNLLSDPTSKEIVAIGNGSRCLYICKPTTDKAEFSQSVSEFTKSHKQPCPTVCFNKTAFSNSVYKQSIDVQTFHARLGHSSVSKLLHIPVCSTMDLINFSCECYMLSKIHRLPFQLSQSKSAIAFELLHMDILGLIRISLITEEFNMPSFANEPFEDELSPLPNTPLPSDHNTSTPIMHNSFVSHTPDLTTHATPDPNASTQIPSATVPNDNRPTYAYDFKGIPHSYIAFLANVVAATDPTIFHQAKTGDGWIEAINKELAALEANQTWTLTSLPSGHTLISLKLVYKTKFKPGGSEERKKARLVVKGFNQKEGLEYKHTFSLVAKLATVRSLYGLKQASRQWNHELTKFLVGLGYVQSKHDYSLFVKQKQDTFTAALLYVDDVLITGDSEAEIVYLKQALDKKFTIKDLGLAKYLKRTVSKGLFYPIQPHLQITGFTDADWASCLMTRRLLTGYCIFLGHSLVSWKTKKQPTVSRSSTEVEYRAMAATTCELLWLSYLLQDLKIKVKLLVTLFCDNKAAQQIAANPCFHDRTKHLEIDCHFTRDKVQDGFLQTAYILTHLQLADIMTKDLGQVQHSFLADKLGISDSLT